MGFFNANTDNPIHKVKFDVTRNLFTLMAIILSGLATLNIIQNDLNMYAISAGAIICIIVLAFLFAFKNYKVAGAVATIMGTGMTYFNMMVTSNFGHFVDFFWIACVVVYTFFILGKYVGTVSLAVNIAIVVLVFYLDRTGQIVRITKEITEYSQLNFIINISLSGVIFAYILIKVIGALQFTQVNFAQANEELSRSNEEKTVMLKEIHHRVKNNLQVISSLLRLQLKDVTDEATKHHFNDSINRVSAMGTIHERMYQTESLTEIDLESYLAELVNDLIASYAVNMKVETNIHSNIKKIEPKSIVPIALIFNELVSNSIEHGFSNRVTGKIEIQAQQDEDGATTVYYRDNGEWKQPARENSLGIELIESFAEQLDGTCTRTNTQAGTQYEFVFKKLL